MVPNAQKFMERRGKTNCKNVETANFFEVVSLSGIDGPTADLGITA